MGSVPWSSSAVCGLIFPLRLLLSCLGKLPQQSQQSVVYVLSDSQVRLFKQEAAALPALSLLLSPSLTASRVSVVQWVVIGYIGRVSGTVLDAGSITVYSISAWLHP